MACRESPMEHDALLDGAHLGAFSQKREEQIRALAQSAD